MSIAPEAVYAFLSDIPKLFCNTVNSKRMKRYDWNGSTHVDSEVVEKWMKCTLDYMVFSIHVYDVEGHYAPPSMDREFLHIPSCTDV